MHKLLLTFALAISVHAQGFWPTAGVLTVTRDNTWKPIGVIPGGANGFVYSLTTNSPPKGCRFDAYAYGGGSAFPFGTLGSIIVQCGGDAVPGDYLLIIKADGVEAVYAVRVK